MRDVKRQLEALADEGEPLGPAEVMRRARTSLELEGAGSRVRGRRVLASAIAAAAVIALVVGTIVVVQRSKDDAPSVVADGTGIGEGRVPSGEPLFPPGSSNPDDAPLFLVPGYLPEGFDLVQATGGNQPGFSQSSGGSPQWDRTQRYVRFDAAHERPVEVLDISWGPGTTALGPPELPPEFPTSDDPLEGFRSQSVPSTVRGRDGLYAEANGWLAWEEPEGRAVLVSGSVAAASPGTPASPGPPAEQAPLSKDLLQAVAEALAPRDDGGFTLTTPPEGFELVAEWPGLASEGLNPRVLIYEGPDGRGVQVHIVDDSESPPGVNLYYSDARLVEVRGRNAVLSPFFFAAPGVYNSQTLFMMDADLFLQWLEPGNVRVTINGLGLDDDEIMRIADGLQPVDELTWFSLQPAAPGGPSPTGPPPDDEEAARQEITEVFAIWNRTAAEAGTKLDLVDDPTGLEEAIAEAAQVLAEEIENYTYRVTGVRFVNRTEAVVTYDILLRGEVTIADRSGRAVLVDGSWRITRDTICNDLGITGVVCSP